MSHSLTSGQIISGRFRILRFINSGGMGEVFEAWDSDLGERVALKTIRPEIASFPDAIDRFKQEVRQARAISHVNVCRVYEVFSHLQNSGQHIWFLTMELLPGETLSERLRQLGPIPEKQALNIVEQMIAGLAAAHEHGVVHRDFKSSNVILVDGPPGKTRVVLTDFGLAHSVVADRNSEPDDPKQGTPRYMAPEQIQGGKVGFAADQYAFGAVICEMLTGQCPIRPTSEKLQALLPTGGHLNARWDYVIRRCLEFRPEDRFASIRDVALALSPPRRSNTGWIIGAAVVATLLVSLFILRARQAGDRVEAAWQLTPDTDLTSRPSLSRDGATIAYSSDRAATGNLDIWVQHLPAGTPKRLTVDPAEDVDPNLAPDGSAVVFRSERDSGGIYLVDTAGGDEHLLAPGGRNPRFSPDGQSITYWVGDEDSTIASGRLFVLSLRDGKLLRLADAFADARYPTWSSDGRYILFSGCRTRTQPLPGCSDWWVVARDNPYIIKETGALALLRKNQIQVSDLAADWYRDKLIFSGRQGSTFSLWDVSLPEATLLASEKPQQLTAGEARAVAPSVTPKGTIAFEHFTAAIHIWRIQHASVAGAAIADEVTHDPTMDVSPSISSNGMWLVFARGYPSERDIWIQHIGAGNEDVFFSAPGDRLSPIIDDAGQKVVFETRERDFPALVAATRSGARTLRAGCSTPTGWFDENRYVFCREGIPSKIEMVDLANGKARLILEQQNVSLSEATWSDKNGYLLFASSPDGNSKQIFATPFSRISRSATGKWIPITEQSGFSDRPRWSGDGKTIFYMSRRDGFFCLWGQRFNPVSGQLISGPFAVTHYHNRRFSPESVVDRSFNVSVSDDSVYLNVAEINTSVWLGRLTRSGFFH